jgi:hypothetical protein
MFKPSAIKYQSNYQGWLASLGTDYLKSFLKVLPEFITDKVKPLRKSAIDPQVQIVLNSYKRFGLFTKHPTSEQLSSLLESIKSIPNLDKIYLVSNSFLKLDESHYPISENDFRWIRFENQTLPVFRNLQSQQQFVGKQDLRPEDLWLLINL